MFSSIILALPQKSWIELLFLLDVWGSESGKELPVSVACILDVAYILHLRHLPEGDHGLHLSGVLKRILVEGSFEGYGILQSVEFDAPAALLFYHQLLIIVLIPINIVFIPDPIL